MNFAFFALILVIGIFTYGASSFFFSNFIGILYYIFSASALINTLLYLILFLFNLYESILDTFRIKKHSYSSVSSNESLIKEEDLEDDYKIQLDE
jgi:hypothetical protein